MLFQIFHFAFNIAPIHRIFNAVNVDGGFFSGFHLRMTASAPPLLRDGKNVFFAAYLAIRHNDTDLDGKLPLFFGRRLKNVAGACILSAGR